MLKHNTLSEPMQYPHSQLIKVISQVIISSYPSCNLLHCSGTTTTDLRGNISFFHENYGLAMPIKGPG